MAEEAPKRTYASEAHVEDVLGEKPLNGYFATIMHLAKCYVGTGIFAMGQGFKNSGLIFGPIMLLVIGIINLNCQHILVKTAGKIASLEDREVKPTFQETVQYTLETSKIECLRRNSKGLGWATNVFLLCCELGFCCVYFVFISVHMVKVMDNHGIMDSGWPPDQHIMLAIILIPMWASTFLGNFKLLVPLSIIANILIWTGIAIVYYFTIAPGLPPASERHLVSSYTRWPLYFGTVLYAFEGITFILPLRNEMKKPEQFVANFGVLNIGMAFVAFLYFSVGFLGYWQYGDEVEGSVFLNLKSGDPIIIDIVDVIMSIAILFTFTLHMYIPFEISFPLFYRKYGPFKHGFLVMAAYRSVPVLLTYFLANVIPFLGLFISLVGATGGAFLALIMPAILELVAFQGELSVIMIIKDSLIIALGVFGSITGTVLSIVDIVEAFQERYSHNE